MFQFDYGEYLFDCPKSDLRISFSWLVLLYICLSDLEGFSISEFWHSLGLYWPKNTICFFPEVEKIKLCSCRFLIKRICHSVVSNACLLVDSFPCF